MENSPQDQGGDVRNTSSDAGTTMHVEDGNGDLSGSNEATATSAQDNSVGARYKLRSPAQLPISRSPCILTIPPGLSPTSFLESPVLLSNIKAEPSPTTGSFSLSKMMQGSGKAAAASLAQNYSNVAASDQTKCDRFEFQFDIGPSAATRQPLSMASSSFQLQHKDSTKDILHENFSRSFAPSSSIKCESRLPQEVSAPSMLTSSNIILDSDLSNHRGQQNCGTQAFPSNNKDAMPSLANDKLSDDGYNWRKYGQKLVKGSEFPRSYYKCTYPNCEVKKIFERSPDGLIKEIVYKGTHDHLKPQSNRRHTSGAVMSRLEERVDRDSPVYVVEDNTNGNTQISYMEQASTPVQSPQQENEDGSDPTLQLQCANEEIDDDGAFSKKRKLDGASDETFVVKPIREPRVVVQTLSEIDILDDGYRWRKYGQKVVRGNPNPRSYYKCTSAGCSVRKHVERASHDPKAVITTYEGKHNHDVPTARMSSHEQAGPPPTMSGIQRTRSVENDSNSVVNHGVGMGYMQQGLEPIDNSRIWPLNLFRPTFQSIFPVE